jgi:hypothetical protein
MVAFHDELEKISAAFGRTTVSKDRAGRRPISISNLLKKEKEGTLYKPTGNDQKIANASEKDAGFDIRSVVQARGMGGAQAAGSNVRDMARAAMQKTHLQAPTLHGLSPSVASKVPHMAEGTVAQTLGTVAEARPRAA